LQLTGQYAGSDVLYGVEQISVGGYYTVRGFPDVSLSGDNGAYLRTDLTLTPGFLKGLLGSDDKVDLFVGYDVGRIWGHYGADDGVMSGMSYGVKWGNDDLSVQMSVTSPIKYPHTMEKPGDFLYASVSFSPEGKRQGYIAPELGDQSWFVGLQRGLTTMRLNDVYVANAVYSLEREEQFSALSVGRDFGRSKIYGTYYGIEQPSDFDYDRFDLTFETRLWDTPSIIPFAAVTVGYGKYEEKNLDTKNPSFVITSNNVDPKDNIVLNGPIYGFSLGLEYELNKHLKASVSYEYAKMHDTDRVFFDGVEENFEMDSITKWMARLDYDF
jgi:hypothetical protein